MACLHVLPGIPAVATAAKTVLVLSFAADHGRYLQRCYVERVADGVWGGGSRRCQIAAGTDVSRLDELPDRLTARCCLSATAGLARGCRSRSSSRPMRSVAASRRHGVQADDLDMKLVYFKRSAHRMGDQHFRDLGIFTGSGAIGGGIKAILAQRAKQSGMRWNFDGAASIVVLRCQRASGLWLELWPSRHCLARRSAPGRLIDHRVRRSRLVSKLKDDIAKMN
jgi:hypothetical protein